MPVRVPAGLDTVPDERETPTTAASAAVCSTAFLEGRVRQRGIRANKKPDGEHAVGASDGLWLR